MSTTGGASWNVIDRTMNAYDFRLSSALYTVGSFLDPVTQINKMTVRRSTNGGVSWDQFTLIRDTNSCGYCVLPNPQDSRVIYVGGDVTPATGPSYPVLLKTTDAGATWKRIGSNVINQQYDRIIVLECDRTNPNKVFAATFYGIYLTTDAGSTWSILTTSVGSVNSLAIDPTNSNNVFVATSNGVLLTTNGGTTWQSSNENLTDLTVQSIEYDATNKVLYAGTKYGGLFRRNLATAPTSVDETVGAIPGEYALHDAYPNPFNPSTTISYSLPKAVHVSLRVFNTLGQEVASLVKGEKDAGTYHVTWNAASMPSGVYIYRLEAGEFVESKKLTLLR